MSDFRFDVETIRKNCEEFFELYDITRDEIYEMCVLKKIHTRAVATNCTRISTAMGLDEYDCDMAWVIGELHDFARFAPEVSMTQGCLIMQGWEQGYFLRTDSSMI